MACTVRRDRRRKKQNPPLAMIDNSTYWSRDRFADEGQPPGTLIQKGLVGMYQGPDFRVGVSGQHVSIDSPSYFSSRELCYQLATVNILPQRPCALLAQEVMIHSPASPLFKVLSEKTCRFKHPEGLRGRGQMDISLQ